MAATTTPEALRSTEGGQVAGTRRRPVGPGLGVRSLGLLTIVALLIVWEIIALGTSPVILPTPTSVAAAFWQLSADGKLWIAFGQMLVPYVEGLVLAIVIGTLAGFALGMSRTVARAAEPVLYMFYSIPHVALLPLVVVWFGIGLRSEVIFVLISAVFAMIVNTQAGVRDVDHRMIEVVRSLGARRSEIVREVVIPSTIPFILSGMRLAVVISVIAVIIAELFISATGIGYLLSYFGDTLQLAKYFAPLILVAAMGVALKQLVDLMDRTLIRWKPRSFGGAS